MENIEDRDMHDPFEDTNEPIEPDIASRVKNFQPKQPGAGKRMPDHLQMDRIAEESGFIDRTPAEKSPPKEPTTPISFTILKSEKRDFNALANELFGTDYGKLISLFRLGVDLCKIYSISPEFREFYQTYKKSTAPDEK